MACEPQFTPGLDFECLKDVISEVRTGIFNVNTVLKALHLAGCALALIPKSNPINPIGFPLVQEMTVDQLCDELEVRMLPQQVSSLDPATVLMIIQLVWKLLQSLK